MRITLKGAAIALALATTALGSASTANAADRVTLDIGNVAVGYSDGYKDNEQRFHRWSHPSDAKRFRAAHQDLYHDYKHDDRSHHDDGERAR